MSFFSLSAYEIYSHWNKFNCFDLSVTYFCNKRAIAAADDQRQFVVTDRAIVVGNDERQFVVTDRAIVAGNDERRVPFGVPSGPCTGGTLGWRGLRCPLPCRAQANLARALLHK